MKSQVLVKDRLIELDAESLEAAVQVEPGVYSVLVEGKVFEVRAATAQDALMLEVQGRRLAAEIRDPRNSSRLSKAAVGAGRQSILAPMPGKVVRVLVSQGDTVEAGQGLVVVEAMKMQNEMKASRPGRVVEVRVKDGDTVGSRDTLVVLE